MSGTPNSSLLYFSFFLTPEQSTLVNGRVGASKCNPVPTNHKCYYNGRRRRDTQIVGIVDGEEAPRNAYPFMVNYTFQQTYSFGFEMSIFFT